MLLWLAEQAEAMAQGAAGAHAGAEQAKEGIPELPNLFGVIHHVIESQYPAVGDALNSFVTWLGFKDPLGTPFSAFENVLYALIVIIALSAFFISGYLRLRKSPKEGRLSRRALFSEIVVLFFDDFFGQIMGQKEARKHLPFVGTLFIYIFCCNSFGLVFLGKAPTANLSFNLGMAFLVFLYVHITGISRSPVGYLKHYPGTLPTIKELGCMGYGLIPFMAVLFTIIHVLEAVIQPVSLTLRLFGNVLGKDVLLGVFGSLMLIQIGGAKLLYFPWHTPFLFLGLLLGAIQALIFSLLSAVYIMLWLPHDEHHEEEHA
jgi:F-type H+-transporting ATPase subunit a